MPTAPWVIGWTSSAAAIGGAVGSIAGAPHATGIKNLTLANGENLPALGREGEALVSVRLQPKSPAAVEEFMAAIWSLDETIAVTMLTGAYDVLVHVSVRDINALSQTVLTAVANAPHVSDEQTSIVFEHRAKRVLGALP